MKTAAKPRVLCVDDGEILRFLVKPCASKDLTAARDAAVARHRALVRQRQLDEEIASGSRARS